ncbi:MAG: rod shape-determining protein MreC [Ignavibacteriales bacterium]|nr:MAG: rod shape-determining protein MreC [Ignavibacteriales bacterium]
MPGFVNRIWNRFREYLILILLLVISLLLISFNNKPPVKKVKAFAFGGFAAITSAFSEIISPFINSYENGRLREVNAKLMLQVNQLREYGIKYDELKRMLGYKDTSDFPLIPCRIISKILSPANGNYIINIGTAENIKKGMPVINDLGLVGVVDEVANGYSIMKSIRNSELKLAVRNQRSRFDGVLEWNGSQLIIKNVPKTFDMEVGDRIVTSDFSSRFPPSIPVGVVAGGNRDKTGLFNNVIVKPFVDLIRIENVFVVGLVQSYQKNNIELNLIDKK